MTQLRPVWFLVEGYVSCLGCGQLFNSDNPAEMAAYDAHDCDELDDEYISI